MLFAHEKTAEQQMCPAALAIASVAVDANTRLCDRFTGAKVLVQSTAEGKFTFRRLASQLKSSRLLLVSS